MSFMARNKTPGGWAMTTTQFEYWKPGEGEERQLRIFISHRYGPRGDQALYDEVVDALSRAGFPVQDVSLSAQQVLSGPRGGALPELKIQAEIAARIYTADILIAPSRPATTRAEWVTWEVQLAAVGYGLPILFVDERNLQLRARLVAEVEKLGAPHRICGRSVPEIVRNVIELAGHPTWAVRQEEPDPAVRYRGPPSAAREAVLKRFPYQPRLPDVASVFPAPPKPRGPFSFFSRRPRSDPPPDDPDPAAPPA